MNPRWPPQESGIVSGGSYSAHENKRIYDKWFSGGRPRDLLLSVLSKKVGFSRKTLCDVGCGYGMHVLLGRPGSYGIELEPYQCRFAESIGIKVYQRDVFEADLSDLPKVDVVLALAIIEHLDSPHVFLRKMHSLLNPDGLLIVETPRKPAFRWIEHLPLTGRLFKDHDDHINAFTESTVRFTCERAGFHTVDTFLWSKPLTKRLPRLAGLVAGRFPLSIVANGVVYVGRKVEGWEYLPRSTRRTAKNAQGYENKEQYFPEKAGVTNTPV